MDATTRHALGLRIEGVRDHLDSLCSRMDGLTAAGLGSSESYLRLEQEYDAAEANLIGLRAKLSR